MRTMTEITHDVGRLLRSEPSEAARSETMDLCQELLLQADRCLRVRDQCLAETIRGWIGRLQVRHGLQ